MPTWNGDVYAEVRQRLGAAIGSMIAKPALNSDVYAEARPRLGPAIGSRITEPALNGDVYVEARSRLKLHPSYVPRPWRRSPLVTPWRRPDDATPIFVRRASDRTFRA